MRRQIILILITVCVVINSKAYAIPQTNNDTSHLTKKKLKSKNTDQNNEKLDLSLFKAPKGDPTIFGGTNAADNGYGSDPRDKEFWATPYTSKAELSAMRENVTKKHKDEDLKSLMIIGALVVLVATIIIVIVKRQNVKREKAAIEAKLLSEQQLTKIASEQNNTLTQSATTHQKVTYSTSSRNK